MEKDTCKRCGTRSELSSDGICVTCASLFGATILPDTDPDATHLSTDGGGRSIDVESIGETFGDYELIEEVARGGMGVIYKARHIQLNRVTALKMILSGRFSSRDELQRFYIEAEAAASLDHPGIVPCYEIGEVEGQAFFAMKFVEGGSLAERLDDVRKDERLAVTILAKVARAVHHAHQRGILHRDLKPANILIDSRNEPLLTDLGLAKKTQDASNLTNTGAVMGTPSYMPPEQASGKDAVTTAADIYSFGAILYEMLTGQPPYRGASAVDTVVQVLNGPPPPPRQVSGGVDQSLELICLKCMARDPDDRYASAKAVAADLESWLQGAPISVSPPSAMARVSHWMRNNYRLAYSLFAVLAGLLITAPFLMEFLTDQQYVRIYKIYPHLQRPWLFSLGRLPGWTEVLALLIIVGFGSSLGFFNALVARPSTTLRAIGSGGLTSLVLYVTFLIFLGWMPLMLSTNGGWRVRRLAAVVWPTHAEDTHEERMQRAVEIFPGLSEIPVEERADAVVSLMEGAQLVDTPPLLLKMTFIVFLISIPIMFGTALGRWLQNRRQSIWAAFIRYQVIWWLSLIATAFAINACLSTPFIGPPPERFGPVVSLVVASSLGLICWLIGRRWRKAN